MNLSVPSEYSYIRNSFLRILATEVTDLIDSMFNSEVVESCVHVVEHVDNLHRFETTTDVGEANDISKQE